MVDSREQQSPRLRQPSRHSSQAVGVSMGGVQLAELKLTGTLYANTPEVFKGQRGDTKAPKKGPES